MKIKTHVKAGGFWGSAWKDYEKGYDETKGKISLDPFFMPLVQ